MAVEQRAAGNIPASLYGPKCFLGRGVRMAVTVALETPVPAPGVEPFAGGMCVCVCRCGFVPLRYHALDSAVV